jgi:signal transduction histidine kinase
MPVDVDVLASMAMEVSLLLRRVADNPTPEIEKDLVRAMALVSQIDQELGKLRSDD